MAVKFLGKNPHRKVVRQIPNNYFTHKIENPKKKDNEDVTVEEKKEENKDIKTNKDMADKRLEKIEEIMGTQAPAKKVKREKKEKGLIERTETILLTEDNKMMLND